MSGRHRVERLSVVPRGGPALVDDVSFSVAPGRVLGVVGETGAGKTLTMRALLGLLPSSVRAEGTLELAGGERLELARPGELQRRLGLDLTCVMQDPMSMLDPLQRVGTQLREGVSRRGVLSRRDADARASALLGKMGFQEPAAVARLYPHQLSGGMAQRVVIAMGMMPGPRILVLDEPTSALDAHVRIDVMRLIRALADEQRTAMLLVSHDLGLVSHFCDEVVVMYAGRVVEQGPTGDVVGAPQHPYTMALLSASATFAGRPRGTTAAVNDHPRAPARAPRRAVVVEDLDVEYRFRRTRFSALRDISLTVEAGETLAVVGESGAGKSTLMRAVAGLQRPAKGRVLVNGQASRPRRGVVSPVQVVFQSPTEALNRFASIGASVAEPLRWMPRHAREARVRSLLEQVGLDPARAGERPRRFSGGQLQRVVLSRALAADPAVLICDEATSALDVSVQVQIADLLLRLQTENGFACLLITHDLGLAYRLADTVMVLRGGVCVEHAPAGRFFLHGPSSDYAQSLLEATRGHLVPALQR